MISKILESRLIRNTQLEKPFTLTLIFLDRLFLCLSCDCEFRFVRAKRDPAKYMRVIISKLNLNIYLMCFIYTTLLPPMVKAAKITSIIKSEIKENTMHRIIIKINNTTHSTASSSDCFVITNLFVSECYVVHASLYK